MDIFYANKYRSIYKQAATEQELKGTFTEKIRIEDQASKKTKWNVLGKGTAE